MSDKPIEWELKRDTEYQYTDGVPADIIVACGPSWGWSGFEHGRKIKVVEKSAYDALKAENERLREELTQLLMKSGTEINILNALTDQQKRALSEYSSLVQAACENRGRALAMLEKMAGASEALLQNYADEKAKVETMRARVVNLDLARLIELSDTLAEYRRDFTPDPRGEPKITEGVPELFK